MDQLDILLRMQRLLEKNEKLFAKHYATLQGKVNKFIEAHFDKYGNTLSEAQKYNRLEQLKKQIDNVATEIYSKILKDVRGYNEESYNEMYLLYTYLLYMSMSEEEGQFQKIAAAGTASSAAVAIAWLLLKKRKGLLRDLKKEVDELPAVFKKHKDYYVYGVYMDIRDSLQVEATAAETKQKAKKRTLNARFYGLNRLRDVWNLASNFAQDKVFELLKEQGGVEKMWISMRDMRVRFAHQRLDSQFADDEGYFHYGGDKAKRPKTWKDPSMNWGCRCKIFLSIDGKIPRTSPIVDYRDGAYLVKLDERIEELQKQGKTYLQAYRQANKEIKPPKRRLDMYITYEDWLEEYGPRKEEEV